MSHPLSLSKHFAIYSLQFQVFSIKPSDGWDEPQPSPVHPALAPPPTRDRPHYVYAPVVYEEPRYAPPPPPPYRAASSYFQCKVCDRGTLQHRTVYRMSGPAVAIGYILLIPSILGMLFAVYLFFASASLPAAATAAATSAAKGQQNAAISNMRDFGVPNRVIRAVVRHDSETVSKWLNQDIDTYGRVTYAQANAVHEAQGAFDSPAVSEVAATTSVASVFGAGASLILLITSFVGGLLGWLLVMRKKVLQCTLCRATVNAS